MEPSLARMGVFKSDGAARASSNMAGCGGLLRGEHGEWLGGFARNLGDTTTYVAELWGVYEGLKLAHSLGVCFLEVQLDSLVVVGSTCGLVLVALLVRLLFATLEGF